MAEENKAIKESATQSESQNDVDKVVMEGTIVSGYEETRNKEVYNIILDGNLGTVKIDIPKLKGIKLKDKIKLTLEKID